MTTVYDKINTQLNVDNFIVSYWQCIESIVRLFRKKKLYHRIFAPPFKFLKCLAFSIQSTTCDAYMRWCFYHMKNSVHVIILPNHLFVLIECNPYDQKVNGCVKIMIFDMVKWFLMLNAQDSKNNSKETNDDDDDDCFKKTKLNLNAENACVEERL